MNTFFKKRQNKISTLYNINALYIYPYLNISAHKPSAYSRDEIL